MSEYDKQTAKCSVDKKNNLLRFDLQIESVHAYRQMLDFLLTALRNGTLKPNFSIELNAEGKSYLGGETVSSDTNAFFTGCAKYSELHDSMKEYVHRVVRGFSYYSDTDDAEEQVPSGGYAAFALGFQGIEHSDIVSEFMRHNDSEHAISTRYLAYEWIDKYGFSKNTIPTILDCIRFGNDMRGNAPLLDRETMQAILDYVDDNGVDFEVVFAGIWDDLETFKTQMDDAPEDDKDLYEIMLAMMGEESDSAEDSPQENSAESYHFPEDLQYNMGENTDLVFFVLNTIDRLNSNSKFQKIVWAFQNERNVFTACSIQQLGNVFVLALIRKAGKDGSVVTIMPDLRQMQISHNTKVALRLNLNKTCCAFLEELKSKFKK